MIDPIVMGAAAGVAANEAQRHIDKHIHQDPGHIGLIEELKDISHDIRQAVHAISIYCKKLDEKPIDMLITLQADPVRLLLRTQGRYYNLLFSPVSAIQITANVPGLGACQFTPAIGWNELDLPDGTELFLSTGNPQNYLLRLTNIGLGANVI